MIIEELVAKLGFKVGSLAEAGKFLRELDKIKKATRDAGKDLKINFGGSGKGLGAVIRDFDRATAAARRFRMEAGRAARAGGGRGPGAYGPGGVPGRPSPHRPGPTRRAGKEFTQGAGVPILAAGAVYGAGAAVGAATRSSMKFERAMIEVSKATDATGSKREDYSEAIMRLARQTGKNKEELAGMLSAAGFAGRPEGELMRFTEFGAKASAAWNTTPEATGQAMAEIGNIYQANQAEIERIGDQINTMADKSASKEVDLLEILRRVGGTGKTAGMSSGDILGFGAGLKERGVQTEIAAGGIEDYINFLKLGDEYSKNASEGIKALGYTSDNLRKMFVAKPTATALEFLDKINAIKDPMKRAEVLTGIFGKTRQDDVERLAASAQKIRENIAMINDPKNYRGSVASQFSEQMNNDVSRIDQATQSIDVLLKRAGDYSKIALGAMAGVLNKVVDKFEDGMKPAESKTEGEMMKRLYEMNGLAEPVSLENFNDRFNAGAPSRSPSMIPNSRKGVPWLTRQPNGMPSIAFNGGSGSTAPTFGGLGNRMGTDWMGKAAAGTASVTNVTNNNSGGNDNRTQSVSISQTISGVEGVAGSAAAGAKSGLGSMGASIVKGQTASTGASASP
ncbi:phage tail tape measure protein [Methylobacterium sp. WL8]|uniref:phage tail tape measure protein n=1 Tax=Methylobacterium sp. WL8 TaxID=2603899 RepID=UPI0011CAB8E3|nr:phage tail tape measure protein [Methylobacterium sp. WL8]TXN76682.1 phage tail tape measure protein [Methylobacterium sp. WL8]